MTDPVRKPATYADLEAVPPHLVAEILDGTLFTHPRPAPRHATAHFALGSELSGPFHRGRGRGGPGGWIFMSEPELHLGPHVVLPDIAALRAERMPTIPDTASIDLIPDWACEILSPSTASRDRGRKRRIYATYGLAHYWLLEPIEKQLEVYELQAGKFVLLETFEEDALVNAPPFAAVPFELSALWPLPAAIRPEVSGS